MMTSFKERVEKLNSTIRAKNCNASSLSDGGAGTRREQPRHYAWESQWNQGFQQWNQGWASQWNQISAGTAKLTDQ
jgi:hypothetical protein